MFIFIRKAHKISVFIRILYGRKLIFFMTFWRCLVDLESFFFYLIENIIYYVWTDYNNRKMNWKKQENENSTNWIWFFKANIKENSLLVLSRTWQILLIMKIFKTLPSSGYKQKISWMSWNFGKFSMEIS